MKHVSKRMRWLSPLLLAACLFTVGSAGAQTYPPSACELQLSTTAVDAGDEFVATACGFESGTGVTFTLERAGQVEPLGAARADPGGEVRVELRVPAGTSLGRWFVRARGTGEDGGLVTLEAVVRVGPAELANPANPANPVDSGGETPSTGLPATGLLAAAAVLAAIIAALAIGGFAHWHPGGRGPSKS